LPSRFRASERRPRLPKIRINLHGCNFTFNAVSFLKISRVELESRVYILHARRLLHTAGVVRNSIYQLQAKINPLGKRSRLAAGASHNYADSAEIIDDGRMHRSISNERAVYKEPNDLIIFFALSSWQRADGTEDSHGVASRIASLARAIG